MHRKTKGKIPSKLRFTYIITGYSNFNFTLRIDYAKVSCNICIFLMRKSMQHMGDEQYISNKILGKFCKILRECIILARNRFLANNRYLARLLLVSCKKCIP